MPILKLLNIYLLDNGSIVNCNVISLLLLVTGKSSGCVSRLPCMSPSIADNIVFVFEDLRALMNILISLVPLTLAARTLSHGYYVVT